MKANDDETRAFIFQFPINFEALKGRSIPFVLTREDYQQNRDFYINNLWNTPPMPLSPDDVDVLLDGIQLPS